MQGEGFRVSEEEAGRRIEKVLARRLAPIGWDKVGRLLRQGRVLVDDLPAFRGQELREGQRVVLERGPRPGAVAPPQPNRRLRLTVLHEDPACLALVKHAPLAVHPGPGHGTDTLLNALVARYPELLALGSERGWGLVHRLDRETSGVMVVARTPDSYERLVEAFRERRVEKHYVALVAGEALAERGEVDAPLDGKEALTRWEVEERAGPVAKVRLRPVTGRTHQLRLHLAGLGAPILGDRRHGGELSLSLAARVGLPRLGLHALSLAWPDPAREGETLRVEAEPPRDLRRAWASARRRAAGAQRSSQDSG